jgi:hypothetical protein
MKETQTKVPGFDAKGLYETWERAASGWFDAWAKSPAFLAAVGQTLEAQLGMKSQAQKAIDATLEAWRIPQARDLEALRDRIAAVEDRIGALEENPGEPLGPAPTARAESRS